MILIFYTLNRDNAENQETYIEENQKIEKKIIKISSSFSFSELDRLIQELNTLNIIPITLKKQIDSISTKDLYYLQNKLETTKKKIYFYIIKIKKKINKNTRVYG